MVTREERIFVEEDIRLVKRAYILRIRREKQSAAESEQYLHDRGYEKVGVEPSALLTPDGREVVRLFGEPWALRPEVHKARLEEAMRHEKMVNAAASKTGPVSEGISNIRCPQMVNGTPCGAALNLKPVCRSCLTGKAGFRFRYSCESCGFDIVTKRELSE
jgi:hypothetical protein